MHGSRARIFLLLFLAGAAAVAVYASAAQARGSRPAKTATTVTYVFSTADNEINGSFNQGWWSNTVTNSDANTNYIAGNLGSQNWRDYFSFSIGALTNPCTPQSAYLTITDPGTGAGPTSLTYGLFDVFTPATVLAQKHNNPNSTVYGDLGSGTNYGTYLLPTSPVGTYTLFLNANGLNAIKTAHANHAAYFSLGGALINAPANSYLMGFTGGSPVTLTVTFPKLCLVG
jgi:hypothetical protein